MIVTLFLGASANLPHSEVTQATSMIESNSNLDQINVRLDSPAPDSMISKSSSAASLSSSDVCVNLQSSSTESAIDSASSSSESSNVKSSSGNSAMNQESQSLTPKRVLHNQQLAHGAMAKEPSTCELSDSLDERPHRHDKIHFCCVDYKKQKKVSPPRHDHEKHPRIDSPVELRSNRSSDRREKRSESVTTEDCVLGRSQARLCSRLDEQSGFDPKENNLPKRQQKSGLCSDVLFQGEAEQASCKPRARLCLGSATLSIENMETQSGIEMNPRQPSLHNSYQCNTQPSLFPGANSIPKSDQTKDPYMPRSEYKVKRTKKGKAKKTKDKYLIFTKGSGTYSPHQIGIKRIKPLRAFNSDGSRLLPNVMETTYNADEGETYDEVDHVIDMHGHIIGMTLSPDHR